MGVGNSKQKEQQEFEDLKNEILFRKVTQKFQIVQHDIQDEFFDEIDKIKSLEHPHFFLTQKHIVSLQQAQFDKTTQQFHNRMVELNHPNIGMKHESLNFKNIYTVTTLQNIKLFKISDAGLKNYISNYEIAYNILNKHEENEIKLLSGKYLSPEQLENLQNRMKFPTYNPYISDVFTLGMLVLELVLWQKVDNLYNWQYCQIKEDKLTQLLYHLKRNGTFSQKLIEFIQELLEIDSQKRYDFIELDKYLSRHPLTKGKRISDYIQAGDQTIIPIKELTQEMIQNSQNKQIIVKQNETTDNINNKINETIDNINNNINETNARTNQQQKLQQTNDVQQYYQQQSQIKGKNDNNIQDQINNLKQKQQELQQQYAALQLQQMQYAQFVQNQQMKELDQFESQEQFMQAMSSTQIQNKNLQNNNYGQQSSGPSIQNNNSNLLQDQQLLLQNVPKQDFKIEDFDLKNEQGQVNYQNGSRYTGELFQGFRNGIGKLVFPDQGYYEGQWKMDKMHGQGTLYYKEDVKAYQGQWEEDMFHKQGKLFNNTYSNFDQEFNYQDFNQLDDKWEFYEGEFQKDLRNGFGVIQLVNGEKFAGNFKDDKVNGYGTYYTKSGKIVNGYWDDNKLVRQI
ncbi:Protein kinase-like domain [Pseudocohnilembus persalinus]|uniref:Protein kinase-like domain n=1 Tax=Pseudocohnilembus persalinus TaxID=266149 RepID=A0A0V0R343_PSEPJ|nr:Protein kinase-like domain [Pseudocohnilembus persalinus]|eukprot:KRX08746.1 Protein kinase-like domain [Pseudocohnilembus persalinus]